MNHKTTKTVGQTTPYTIRRATSPINIDGNLEKEAWQQAVFLPSFADKTDGRRALFDTQAAMLWDDVNLYVSFRIEDRDVWSTRQTPVTRTWMDNTMQVSVAGPGAHYELMVNPMGETCEIFYIWKDSYKRGGRYDITEFDLATHRPMVLGGDAGTDPRGMRWVFFHWSYPGLKVAVQADGTLDNRNDIDSGWTVELAFPWEGMTRLMASAPPKPGDVWRIGLIRNQVIDQRSSFYQVAWTPYPAGEADVRHPDCIPETVFEGA